MKRHLLTAMAICAAIVLVASCSKKTETKKTNTDYLTQSVWKYDTAALDLNMDGTMDFALPPGVLEDCYKDNTITFQAGGTGTVDDGATKCNPGDPQTTAFSWTFQSNETVLNFPNQIFPNFDGDVTIKTLTDTKLTLIKAADVGLPQMVNIIVDLKH